MTEISKTEELRLRLAEHFREKGDEELAQTCEVRETPSELGMDIYIGTRVRHVDENEWAEQNYAPEFITAEWQSKSAEIDRHPLQEEYLGIVKLLSYLPPDKHIAIFKRVDRKIKRLFPDKIPNDLACYKVSLGMQCLRARIVTEALWDILMVGEAT